MPFIDGQLVRFTDSVTGNFWDVDVSVTQSHDLTIDLTDFPVERGVNITDHKRRKPDTVKVEGFISNAPARKVEDLGVGYYRRGKDAYDFIRNLAESAGLVTITTKLRTYSNMALASLSTPVTAAQGDGLTFTATFKEIRVVENKTVIVTTRTAGGQKKSDKGKLATETKEADSKKKTLAKHFDSATGNYLRDTARGALLRLIN